MFSRTSIIAAFAAAFAFTSIAAAETGARQVIYAGGHDPIRLVRVEPKPQASAPYALTGNESTRREVRYENLWIGSRFVGVRIVGQ